MTTLIEAIEAGVDKKELKAILAGLSDNPNETDGAGLTALHHAVIYENLEAIDFLVGVQADWSAQDLLGNTPLHYLAKIKEPKILAFFRQHVVLPEEVLNIQNESGQTPAFIAAQSGNLQSFESLVEAGADLEVLDWDFVSPLFAAISNDHQEVTDYIVAKIYEQPHIFGAAKDLIKTFPEYKPDVDDLLKYEFEPHDILQKYVAHQLGFDKRVSGEVLSGANYFYTFPWIVHNLQQYVHQQEYQGNSAVAERFNAIKDVLAFNMKYIDDPELCAKKLHTRLHEEKKPIVFLSGWINHAVSIVVKEDQLIICNRGDGADYDDDNVYGIVAYKLQKPLTQEQLSVLSTHDSFENEHLFNAYVSRLVAEPPAPMEPLYKVPAKELKYGLCSFANLKHAAKALWILFEQEKYPRKYLQEIINEANWHYGDFKNSCRDFVVAEIVSQIKTAKPMRQCLLATLMMQVIDRHPGTDKTNGFEMNRARTLLEHLPPAYQTIFVLTHLALSIQLNPELTQSVVKMEAFAELASAFNIRENVEEKTKITQAFLLAIKEEHLDLAKKLYGLQLVDLSLADAIAVSQIDKGVLQEVRQSSSIADSTEKLAKVIQQRKSMMFSEESTKDEQEGPEPPSADNKPPTRAP